nr:hypothetical protein GCM10020063_031060 [Dactylosporangium thailandense]
MELMSPKAGPRNSCDSHEPAAAASPTVTDSARDPSMSAAGKRPPSPWLPFAVAVVPLRLPFCYGAVCHGRRAACGRYLPQPAMPVAASAHGRTGAEGGLWLFAVSITLPSALVGRDCGPVADVAPWAPTGLLATDAEGSRTGANAAELLAKNADGAARDGC